MHNIIRVTCCTCVCSICAFQPGAVTGQVRTLEGGMQRKSVVDRDTLIDGIGRSYDTLAGLDSFYVEYRQELTKERDGDPMFAWDWINVVNATKKPKLYMKIIHPRGNHDRSAPGDTYELICAWNGGLGVQVETNDVPQGSDRVPNAPTAGIMGNPPGRIFQRSYYFMSVAFSLDGKGETDLTARERHFPGQFWLPNALTTQREKYIVLPLLEQCGDVWCHVLEYPGMDKLWIDTDHGYAIKRREEHWEPGGLMRAAFTYADHVEIVPGLWLPKVVERSQYAGPWNGAAVLGKVLFRCLLSVRAIHANDVPDTLFEDVTVPIGALCYDWRQQLYFTNYGPRDDPLGRTLESAMTLPPGVRPSRRRWLLIVVMFLAVGTFVALIVRRLRTSRNAPKPER